MALVLHTGNELERLGDRLIAALAERLRVEDPSRAFVEELVLVPTAGLRTWLRQRVAERLGICAGLRFCYPAQLFAWLGRRLDLVQPDQDWLDRARWLVLRVAPEIPALGDYLDDERHCPGPRAYALAGAVAECFDRYALYRPGWLEDWAADDPGECGAEISWQPALWRRLLALGLADPAAAHDALLQALTVPAAPAPTMCHVFGFNSISPRVLHVLRLLAARGTVQVHSLQPSWGYWADQRARVADPDQAEDDNRLLGDWGAIGKVFLRQLDDAGADYRAEPDDYRQPGTDTLLHRLQQDIADACASHERGPHSLTADDRSLRIHACHDLRRQVEAVKEEIHRAFAELPDLQAHEVAVMAPDPTALAPLAQAVLSDHAHGPPLPIVIADRSQGQLDAAAEVLVRLLELLPSRFLAGDVLDLVGMPAVARAWGFGAEELALIRAWVDAADLRWGVDEVHRREVAGHAYRAGSWRRGLQRLQLAWWYGEDTGDALPFAVAAADPADAVVPVDGFEPGHAEIFDRFLALLEPLLQLAAPCRAGAAPTWWRDEMTGAVRHLLRTRDDAPALAGVAAALGQWCERLSELAWTQPLAGPLVHAHFRHLFDQASGGDFARGAITVCGLQPMRSIPFRVLCLVGMDDGAFPRQAAGRDFDLMRRHPRPGDRDLRREDRYLFLESVISTRDRLCIGYTGFEGGDHARLPPAGLVGELLDVAAATCGLAQDDARARLVSVHRLHRSLEGPTWPSAMVVDEYRALRGPRCATPFATPVLASPQPRVVALEDLIAFWRRPARAYLRCLGVGVRRVEAAPRAHERFAPATDLDRYRAAGRLLAAPDDPADTRAVRERLAAEGWLPPGALATAAWHDLNAFVGHLRAHCTGLHEASTPCRVIAETAAGPIVDGELAVYHPSRGVVMIHPGGSTPAKHLELWIQVLVAAHAGLGRTGVLLCVKKGKVQELSLQVAADDPALAVLVDGYQRGQGELLPFAVATAHAYAVHRWQRDAPHGAALGRAQAAWQGDGFSPIPGEAAASEHRLVWDPITGPTAHSDFIHWAGAVWRPALAAAASGRGHGR